MNETNPIAQEQTRINDSAKAEVMAYAGKFERDAAAGGRIMVRNTIGELASDGFSRQGVQRAEALSEASKRMDTFAVQKEDIAGKQYDQAQQLLPPVDTRQV